MNFRLKSASWFRLLLTVLAPAASFGAVSSGPVFLEDQFELPAGFRIYKAATAQESGQSYALTFDGQGRLLVGEGTTLRRLKDENGDGVYDSYETLATGLGGRGPQGILVYGDRLYAVGGDGIQLYEGYNGPGPLRHLGRIGEKLGTGGDHDAHTLLRGFDGYVYFMAGNGSGIGKRKHITEETSPMLFERQASVYRIDPDGKKWECVAAGGRNPPNLGLNYLGDFFSFDSDMEWHVGLPFYRPVRLNHWMVGGDQGWHEVGALPPYSLDTLPGVLDVGRGSPTWGTFYEHNQFPERYRNAFVVCDYRWKSATSGNYNSVGRLVSFFLRPDGSRWRAEAETFVRPKPGAKDPAGKPIDFALVDAQVGPDGSLFITDHNQGIWRLVYDPQKRPAAPPIAPAFAALPSGSSGLLTVLLTLPQPGSERTRLREEEIKKALGEWEKPLANAVFDASLPVGQRLRAVRLLSPNFSSLPSGFLEGLAQSSEFELRGQAAWLIGIRRNEGDYPLLRRLLGSESLFVRRKCVEAMTQIRSSLIVPDLIRLLSDPDRALAYGAMMALTHYPADQWFPQVAEQGNFTATLRGLTALYTKEERPAVQKVGELFARLVKSAPATAQEQLDLMRSLDLYRGSIEQDQPLKTRVAQLVAEGFPSEDGRVTWEKARLIGSFQVTAAIPSLLKLLETDKDEVHQFHYAQNLAALKSGWDEAEEKRFLGWMLAAQQGWFADRNGKGVQFPDFWMTVLNDFGANHPDALIRAASSVRMEGPLGGILLNQVEQRQPGFDTLAALYRGTTHQPSKARLLKLIAKSAEPRAAAFVRSETPSGPVAQVAASPERADGDLMAYLMKVSYEAGDRAKGAKVFERLLCHTCHGGGTSPGQEGRLFGPDLVGVTRRLPRKEFAESIVFPSKQVADRYKATEVRTKDDESYTGFVTAQTAESVTLAAQDRIHVIPIKKVESIRLQEKSLMPDHLLSRVEDRDIADLVAFINALGAASPVRK